MVGHVLGKLMRKAYKILVCKPKRKTLFGKLDNAGKSLCLATIIFYILCRLVYPINSNRYAAHPLSLQRSGGK